MKVLEVYPFGKGLGQAFRARGHEVFTVDFKDTSGHTDLIIKPEQLDTRIGSIDLSLDRLGGWDVVLLRPFCTTYSRASAFMHYRNTQTGEALTDKAREGDRVVKAMLAVKDYQVPRIGWVLENPHGFLRKCSFMKDIPVVSCTLCQYGHECRKETDLFGYIPEEFKPKSCKSGSDCHLHSDWTKKGKGDALRNTYTSPLLRATLPYKLSEDICKAFEAVA